MADNKTPIRDINGHLVVDQEARDQAAQNAGRIGELYEEVEGIKENGGAGVAVDATLTQEGQAADAKAVGEKVKELSEEKLDKTHFDAETIPLTIDGYVDSGDGTITTSTSAKCTDFIDIVGAKEINYRTRISSSSASVAFYDADKNYLEELSIDGVGEWQEGVINLTGQVYADAAFVRVSVYGLSNISSAHCILYRGYNLDRMVSELDSLKEKSESLESAMLEKVTPDDTTFFDSNEHFDKSQAEIVRDRFADAEGYVGAGAGTISVIFPVTPSTEYVLQINPERKGRNRNVIVGGTSKEFPKGYYTPLNKGIPAQNNALAFSTAADTTWAFAYIESGSTEYSLDDFSLQANGIPVDAPATIKRVNLPADIVYNDYTSKPDGINVLIFGDSITDSVNMTTDTITNLTTAYAARTNKDNSYTDADGNLIRFYMWPTLFQQLVKCQEVRNYALAGASYKDKERTAGNERQNVSYQVEVALNDLPNTNSVFKVDDFSPDLVIFALGTNDGEPNDTFESAMDKTVLKADGVSVDVDATLAALDRTKFCEAARYAMLKIRKAFPSALGMCVLPIQRASNETPGGTVRDMLRDVANRCGYIALDGYGEMGIIRDLETVDALGACLKDGLHPNDVGQKMYARMIVQAVRRYFLPLTEFAD